MKKWLSIFLLVGLLFTTSGCEERINDELNILTTIYPITYLAEELYPEGNISSIYPDGIEINSYVLTEKRLKDYSTNDIFIYNGLSNELNTAKDLINNNQTLRVIDAAYGLKVNNGIEELWLSPNYYLMLATTIKENIQKIADNKYVNENIEKKYKSLEETLSVMDAELRNIAKEGNNTIIASSNMLKYLENYGFKVISLTEKENLTNTNLANIKANFENNTYTTIFMTKKEEKTELITSLETDYNAKIVTVNTMETLTTEEKENNENYLTIMEQFIENIRKVTLGE